MKRPTLLMPASARIMDFIVERYRLGQQVTQWTVAAAVSMDQKATLTALLSLVDAGYLIRQKGDTARMFFSPVRDSKGREVEMRNIEEWKENGVPVRRYPPRYADGYGFNNYGVGLQESEE